MRVSIVSRWDEMDCSRSCLVRSNVAYWDGENVMEDNSDWIWDSLDAVVVRFDASLGLGLVQLHCYRVFEKLCGRGIGYIIMMNTISLACTDL